MSSTAVPGPVGRPRGRRLSSIFKRQGVQALLFISPAVLLLGVLIVYPMIRTSIYSFANLNSRLEVTRWIGFDNYTRLFTKDKSFLNLEEFPPSGALANNVKWMILYTSLSLLLGLLIAVLAARVRYESLMKAIVFVPMAIAATAVAIIWKFVYEPDPNLGSLNAFITTSAPTRSPGTAGPTPSTTRSSSRTSGRRPASRWWCCRRR